MNRVCLLRPDKAGDALKTLPALRGITSVAPWTEIHLVVSQHNESLFAYEKHVTLHRLPKSWETLSTEQLATTLAPRFSEAFDLAVNLQADPFPETTRLLNAIPSRRRCSVATDIELIHGETLCFPKNSPVGRDERKNIALLIDQALKIKTVDRFELESSAPILSPEDAAEAGTKLGPKTGRWLAFCPLAGTQQRSHPVARWRRFIKNITSRGDFNRYFLFGGPGDRETLEKIRTVSKEAPRVEIVSPSSFRALGAYLKRMDGICAVDSGPLHLALSLQVPSLGLLSGGDRTRWFSHTSRWDWMVPRGLLGRYPSAIEMRIAYGKWKRLAFGDKLR